MLQNAVFGAPLATFFIIMRFASAKCTTAHAFARANDTFRPNFHNNYSAWRGDNTHPGLSPLTPGLSRPRQTSSERELQWRFIACVYISFVSVDKVQPNPLVCRILSGKPLVSQSSTSIVESSKQQFMTMNMLMTSYSDLTEDQHGELSATISARSASQ